MRGEGESQNDTLVSTKSLNKRRNARLTCHIEYIRALESKTIAQTTFPWGLSRELQCA